MKLHIKSTKNIDFYKNQRMTIKKDGIDDSIQNIPINASKQINSRNLKFIAIRKMLNEKIASPPSSA